VELSALLDEFEVAVQRHADAARESPTAYPG
jgi:hypothetical protein